MVTIEAGKKYYQTLNKELKSVLDHEITVTGVMGQRYLGTGLKNKELTVYGTPGNALGAYLNETKITVYGNVQDAVGDTMDSGEIVVHGNCGDTLGYGMRGGRIFIQGNGGYRLGIHMKAYGDHQPVIVIGGTAGSFLGEYQAGGTLIVLGLDSENSFPAGNYCGTGMHGGVMYIRSDTAPKRLPEQVNSKRCTDAMLQKIMPLLEQYSHYFDTPVSEILKKPFYELTPSANNPYNKLYTEYIQ